MATTKQEMRTEDSDVETAGECVYALRGPAFRLVVPGDGKDTGVQGAELLEQRRAHVCAVPISNGVQTSKKTSRTQIARTASRALVTDFAVGGLAVLRVGDLDPLGSETTSVSDAAMDYMTSTHLVAVAAGVVDVRGNSNDGAAVNIGVATCSESDVKPSALKRRQQ